MIVWACLSEEKRQLRHCYKEALLGAKLGAEVRFINTSNLRIDRCTGCGACDKRMEKAVLQMRY